MKQDYIAECLSDITKAINRSVPIDAFCSEYCKYCQNPTCSRSGMNNGLFQLRAKNWYNDLFANPRIAGLNDRQYDSLREKWVPKYAVISQDSEEVPEIATKVDNPINEIVLPAIQDETSEIGTLTHVNQEEEFELPHKPEELPVTPVVVTQPAIEKKPMRAPQIMVNPFESPQIENNGEDIVIDSGGSFTFGN